MSEEKDALIEAVRRMRIVLEAAKAVAEKSGVVETPKVETGKE